MRLSRSISACRLGPIAVALSLALTAACGSDGVSAADGEIADSTTTTTTTTTTTVAAAAEEESTDDGFADDGSADDGADATDSDGSEDGSVEDGSVEEGSAGGEDGTDGGELFPDVLDATASSTGDGTWTFSATLSSPYDTPERYADAWRVVGPDGEVYGIRELTHDHANEQPFTRSHSGIEIPEDVAVVTVEGRDQISGWGGATVEVVLER